MNGKGRIDYLLTKVPEDKKEVFVEDLKGVASFEEGLSVLKKYDISLTEEEMKKLTANILLGAFLELGMEWANPNE
ncbi:MAG: hypothetical protein K6E30_09355 [Lachnospiraceae bacterium]|nr:hypothetical protein [Lachnospiraceae bacterium]